MFQTLVTPAAAPLMSTADAKQFVRIDYAEDDAIVAGFVAAATGFIEKVTARALLSQTWRVSLPGFCGNIYLPMVPVASVVSVAYYDKDNVLQTLDPAAYMLIPDGDKPYLYATDGWPSAYVRPDAVSVEYVAGYGTASDVPPELVQVAQLLLGLWESSREAATKDDLSLMPLGVQALLANYRRTGGMF